jgi:hypothetical protein
MDGNAMKWDEVFEPYSILTSQTFCGDNAMALSEVTDHEAIQVV